MDDLHVHQLKLLQGVLPAFQDVADFYIGPHPRAVRARNKVNKTSPLRSESFHSTVNIHLANLKSKVETCTTELLLSSAKIQSAMEQLLVVLEDTISDFSSGSNKQFPALAAVARAHVLERTYMYCPALRYRRMIEQALAGCVAAFGADRMLSTVSELAQSTLEWQPASKFCQNVESAETVFQSHLPCGCKTPHEAVLSFASPCATPAGDSSCCMYFQREAGAGWQRAEIQLEKGRSGRHARFEEQTSHETSGLPSNASQAANHRSPFCEIFQRNSATVSLITVHDEHLEVQVSDVAKGSEEARIISLRSWFTKQQTTFLSDTSETDRLALAILLAYAYLHLSGSTWWPDDKVDPDIWFSITSNVHSSRLRQPFMTLECSGQTTGCFVERGMNPTRPSLPAFGKMLLELWVGRPLAWDNTQLDQAKEQCSKTIIGKQFYQVVDACIYHNELFREQSRLKDHMTMKAAFLARVVKILQHIFSKWAEMKMEDIFVFPKSSQNEPGQTSSSSRSRDYLMSAEEAEKLRPAETWMERLKSQVVPIFENCQPTSPVKVAILDTGANFDLRVWKLLYRNRIKQYWSWCAVPNAVEGRSMMRTDGHTLPQGEDTDGHGTHVMSVLLNVSPHCEVYIAKVFDGRDDLKDGKPTELMASRIANAINHAVSVWEVDVVSMSFGFADEIDSVRTAIDDATAGLRPVIMLAAASNEGGNEDITWPARYDRVICVHAADGDGNKYGKNPTSKHKPTEFATLGCHVKSWVGPGKFATHSGTSVATPVAAGIAAMTIHLLRGQRDWYLEFITRDLEDTPRYDRVRRSREMAYDRDLRTLGTCAGMSRVFALMAGDMSRDGYRYLRPWDVLNEESHASFVVAQILKTARK